MKLSFLNLSKDQTNIVKGFAMVCLVLHNFLHWTNGIGENEMNFDPNRIYVLFQSIVQDKMMLFNGLISYFGFYFLELFIFITAYGLTKQYRKKESISYFKFIVPKLIKIYFLLIYGIIIYSVFRLFYDPMKLDWFISFVSSILLMYNNFTFNRIFAFIGPWWYFSLTIQLYLIFPFLYKFLNEFKERGFFISITVLFFLIAVLFPLANDSNIPIFGNFLGHLPEFLLGMGMAMFKQFKIDWKVIVVSLIIFILSNFYVSFYPFTFFTSTVLLLVLMYPLMNIKSRFIKQPLIFLGSISMFMFLINGPLRFFTIPYAEGHSPLYILLLSVIHLVFVIIVSYIISLIYSRCVSPIVSKLIAKLC